MLESYLHSEVFNYYKREGEWIFSEIPFMSRIIDLVILEENFTTTYELKISKWKHAIEQMKEHRIASDFCYLCMPKISVGYKLCKTIIKELTFYGFGFQLWDDEYGRMETKLLPKKNKYVSEPGRSRLRKNIYALARKKNNYSDYVDLISMEFKRMGLLSKAQVVKAIFGRDVINDAISTTIKEANRRAREKLEGEAG